MVPAAAVGLAALAVGVLLAATDDTALRMAVRPAAFAPPAGGGTGCGSGDVAAASSPTNSLTSELSMSPSARDESRSLLLPSLVALGVRRSTLALDFFAPRPPALRPFPFLPDTGSAGGGSDPDSLRLSRSGSGD